LHLNKSPFLLLWLTAASFLDAKRSIMATKQSCGMSAHPSATLVDAQRSDSDDKRRSPAGKSKEKVES
jgi:hypothetical protein